QLIKNNNDNDNDNNCSMQALPMISLFVCKLPLFRLRAILLLIDSLPLLLSRTDSRPPVCTPIED
ncbi:MAG: hypothetical protein ACJ70Y_03740, partial [Nitrososphaera sp.]